MHSSLCCSIETHSVFPLIHLQLFPPMLFHEKKILYYYFQVIIHRKHELDHGFLIHSANLYFFFYSLCLDFTFNEFVGILRFKSALGRGPWVSLKQIPPSQDRYNGIISTLLLNMLQSSALCSQPWKLCKEQRTFMTHRHLLIAFLHDKCSHFSLLSLAFWG